MSAARRRSAGLVGAAVAVFFLSLTGPADASPTVDTTYTWTCGTWTLDTQDINVAPVVPCIVSENIFRSVSNVLGVVYNDVEIFLALDLSGLAETFLAVYVAEPLESIPFFGNGLADLAIALVSVPVQLVETLIDFAGAALLSGLSVASWFIWGVGNVFAWFIGFGWWIANRLFFFFAGVTFAISEAVSTLVGQIGLGVSTAIAALTGWFADLPAAILGVFVNPVDAAFLLTSFQDLVWKLFSIVGSVANVFGAFEIVDAADLPGVSMPGGVSVNVLAVFDTMPPALSVAVQAFVGFWLVFGVVQAIGSIARMTDAS